MTEAMSLAGMAETPLVVYLAQRSGPSTGVPTYTEQGDLKMVLNRRSSVIVKAGILGNRISNPISKVAVVCAIQNAELHWKNS